MNGCVEAAKVFFELFRAAYPGYKAAYLDSFDAAGEGSRAVPLVKGSGGEDYIVDAAAFARLPGPGKLDEFSSVAGPDFRYLQDYGYILPFTDAAKSGFLYTGSGGALSKQVIYGCYTTLPENDEAEKKEQAARENYKKTGKTGIDWSRTPY